ncbi:hypothetical protein NL463_27755, partial [Klebsiella pneumoniae]|nr:hypothetical protein [Klebsiella pneumoniae]
IATALFALSDASIWHVVESKQYTSDVFVALLLWLCATTRWNDEQSTSLDRRRLLLTACVAAAGVWLSTPAAFVFGGISLTVLAAARGVFLRSP